MPTFLLLWQYRLKEIFTQHLTQALELLIEMDLVEITG